MNFESLLTKARLSEAVCRDADGKVVECKHNVLDNAKDFDVAWTSLGLVLKVENS